MTVLESLDPERILSTSRTLDRRIAERFPNAGLGRVCGQLVELASRAQATTQWIGRPNKGLRALSVGVIGTILIVSGVLVAASFDPSSNEHSDFSSLVQTWEAAMNGLVLVGAAVWFFISLETRFKRGRVLSSLHELRTLAHLIDVHQLTKNPDVLRRAALPTASSPVRTLTGWELGRYLDYCTEMLSLTGKIAALYAEGFSDAQAVDAVTDLESLTNALQQKIWQKIMLLESRGMGRDGAGDATGRRAGD